MIIRSYGQIVEEKLRAKSLPENIPHKEHIDLKEVVLKECLRYSRYSRYPQKSDCTRKNGFSRLVK